MSENKIYFNSLEPIKNPLPLLADYPEFIEPLQFDRRYLANPIVYEEEGELFVQSWRYWYNVRGIVEMENRLTAKATAIVNVHPWGVDDGHGLKTPEPAGIALFCTKEKNLIAQKHVKEVINTFFRRLRDHVALIGHSMPGTEDPIRKLIYPSVSTKPEELDIEKGEKLLAELLSKHNFSANPLIDKFEIDMDLPVKSYFEKTPSTDAGDYYNGVGFWQLPMPVLHCLDRGPNDLVFYDGEGYPKVRDCLKSMGVRHILLTGYCTDMCVISTTCGYNNLSQDFNLFLVGDATLATYPGSRTPKYATQVALANASLRQMITQVSFVRLER
ncbi:MAG: isochorismatase family protein [Candidatus Poribacteria bacterium]